MFAEVEDLTVAAITHNGHAVPELITTHAIDVVLLDISMPILDGPGVLQLLQKEGLATPVLILTMHTSLKDVRKCLSLGAAGYILKDARLPDLVEAVRQIAEGGNYFHPKIQQQMLAFFQGKKINDQTKTRLSRRELEIIRALAQGDSSKEIAERLFLSDHTVRTHRRNILLKLGVNNTPELIHLAMENGWI